jgi:hypothetical protein
MHVDRGKCPAKVVLRALLFAVLVLGFGASALAGADPDDAVDSIQTATPIKHVVIIVGENAALIIFSLPMFPKARTRGF